MQNLKTFILIIYSILAFHVNHLGLHQVTLYFLIIELFINLLFTMAKTDEMHKEWSSSYNYSHLCEKSLRPVKINMFLSQESKGVLKKWE